MRTAIVGGGPGGLYLSILLKKLDPAHDVVVYERNAPADTFGFGVVFSDETLAAFEAADPETYAEITRRFARWAEIDVHYRGEVMTSGGHGFSGARARRPARRAPAPGRGARRRPALPHRGRRRRPARGLRPRRRRRRRQQHAARPLRRRLRAVARPPPREVHLVRHRPRPRRLHVLHQGDRARRLAGPRLSLQRHDEHVHRGDDAAGVARARARPRERGGEPRDVRGAVRRPPRRPPPHRQPLAVDRLRHGAQPVVAPRERRAARRRRAHGALLDRIRHEARDGGRDRARLGVPRARLRRRPRRARGLRGRAPANRRVDAARGAGQPRVVRGHRALHGPGAADLRVQPADPQPAHHLHRAPAARPAVRRGRRRAVLARPAADVHAVPPARPGAGKPRRGLADGHVLGGRRHAGRLPPRAPRRARDRRRRARDDRDDLRLAPRGGSRPAAAACTATSTRRRGSGSSTSSTRTGTRRSAASSATPGARARRSSCGRPRTGRSTRATGR